jgi:hypothetical protein
MGGLLWGFVPFHGNWYERLKPSSVCRRLTPEEAAASRASLEQVAPDSSLVQAIMEAFLESTTPPTKAPQAVTGNPEGG